MRHNIVAQVNDVKANMSNAEERKQKARRAKHYEKLINTHGNGFDTIDVETLALCNDYDIGKWKSCTWRKAKQLTPIKQMNRIGRGRALGKEHWSRGQVR